MCARDCHMLVLLAPQSRRKRSEGFITTSSEAPIPDTRTGALFFSEDPATNPCPNISAFGWSSAAVAAAPFPAACHCRLAGQESPTATSPARPSPGTQPRPKATEGGEGRWARGALCPRSASRATGAGEGGGRRKASAAPGGGGSSSRQAMCSAGLRLYNEAGGGGTPQASSAPPRRHLGLVGRLRKPAPPPNPWAGLPLPLAGYLLPPPSPVPPAPPRRGVVAHSRAISLRVASPQRLRKETNVRPSPGGSVAGPAQAAALSRSPSLYAATSSPAPPPHYSPAASRKGGGREGRP